MGGNNLGPEYERLVRRVAVTVFVFAAFLASLIVASWLMLLTSFAGIIKWPPPPSVPTLVTYFLISFSVVCATLWLGSQVEVLKLKDGAEKMIGRVFAAAALGAVVTAFVKMVK